MKVHLRYFWLVIILSLSTLVTTAQYYLRGEVKNEYGLSLPDVKIFLSSKGTVPFSSGSSGTFGIPVSKNIDTITLMLDGYETLKKAVESSKFQVLTMKVLSGIKSINHQHLSSFTKDLLKEDRDRIIRSNESYSRNIENNFIKADKYPQTGFSLTVDRASYSNIRRFLNMNSKVPPDAVRIEEILNYFNLNYDINDLNTAQFNFSSYLTNCPWNIENQLLFVNVKAPQLDVSNLPPNNLIFLVDVSGSMDKPNRLPLLKSAFKLLVRNLRQNDTLAIVVYGGDIGVWLPPTSGCEKKKIIESIEKLNAAGSTPGESAIRSAYILAKNIYNPKANNRVILATDGDFNIGQNSEEELDNLITQHRQTGIYLTCLGVGMGNYKDSKLEVLAKKGNGNFAYLDNMKEAEKVLITEFTKTMYTVANDAFINVNFDPEFVKEYRLIGFDNKEDALNDTTSKVEGGEIGSGHPLMAVFEINPTEKNKELFQLQPHNALSIATLNLQYKLPSLEDSLLQQQTIPLKVVLQNLQEADSFIRLTTALTLFGSLIKQSEYIKDYTWTDVFKFISPSIDKNDPLQTEFLALIQKAGKIYGIKKKKKTGSLLPFSFRR